MFTAELEITVDYNLVAVCSGDLVAQVLCCHETILCSPHLRLNTSMQVCDDGEKWRRFHYSVPHATVASGIVLNVAPFVMIPDKNLPGVTYFCTTSSAGKVPATTAIVSEIKSFLETYLDEPFPHKSFHVIFDHFPDMCELAAGTGVAVLSDTLLHGDDVVEEALESTARLAFLWAYSWAQAAIKLKSWRDLWIHIGIAGFLRDAFLRVKLGENDYKWRMKRACQDVASKDVHMAPLCPETSVHPAELIHESAMAKAPLVMTMLERRIQRKTFKAFLRTLMSTRNNARFDAKKFMKHFKTETSYDPKVIADMWVYGSGCPQFSCGLTFNEMTDKTEVSLCLLTCCCDMNVV